VTGNIDGLVLVGEEEVVRAVFVAEDPTAVIEGVFAANVFEADRAFEQLGLDRGLPARQADDLVGHGFLLRTRSIAPRTARDPLRVPPACC
jgi:hypothetical protein